VSIGNRVLLTSSAGPPDAAQQTEPALTRRDPPEQLKRPATYKLGWTPVPTQNLASSRAARRRGAGGQLRCPSLRPGRRHGREALLDPLNRLVSSPHAIESNCGQACNHVAHTPTTLLEQRYAKVAESSEVSETVGCARCSSSAHASRFESHLATSSNTMSWETAVDEVPRRRPGAAGVDPSFPAITLTPLTTSVGPIRSASFFCCLRSAAKFACIEENCLG